MIIAVCALLVILIILVNYQYKEGFIASCIVKKSIPSSTFNSHLISCDDHQYLSQLERKMVEKPIRNNNKQYSYTCCTNPDMDGKKGEKGLQGDKGPIGDMGSQGDMGPQGEKGDIGPDGKQGKKGPDGDVSPTVHTLQELQKRLIDSLYRKDAIQDKQEREDTPSCAQGKEYCQSTYKKSTLS
jgi:hypothetical protein